MANIFEDIVEEELARQDQQAAAPPPHAGATAENMFQDIVEEELQSRGELAVPSQSDQQRGSFLDSVGQGLSMGFGDEIAGAAAGAYNAVRGRGFQEGYEGTRDALRSNYGAYKERQPYWSMAGEIAGGVVPSFVPGLNVARAGSLGAAALRGAGAGALGGAVYGYGQGEDGIANRAGNAAMGAAVGGTIGGALPAATVGIKRGAQAIKDVVRPNAASRAGINRPAQREISRTLDADDMTIQDVADRLREYGNDAAIVDASDGLRETGRQMVQFGSPGSAPLAKLGKERGRQVASRVNNAFEEVLGQRPSPAELVEALKKRTQRNAGQNFGAARTANAGRPVSTQGVVDDLVTDTGSLDAADVLARRDLSLPEDRMRQEFTRRLTRDRADEATETIRSDLRSYRPDAPRPESLGSFLRRKGFDPATRDRGDLDAIIGTSAGRARGLLRSGGYRDLDDAAEAAHEAGFISERTPRALLDALDDDLRGNPVYSVADEDLAFAWREFDEGMSHARAMREELPGAGQQQRLRQVEPISDYDEVARTQTLMAKRLREMSRSADGDQRFVAGEVRGYHDRLVGVLDEATGGQYSVARGRYADDKQLEEAFDYGFQKAMAPGTEISFLRKEWEALSTPAKVAARAGLRAWLGQKSASFRGAREQGRNVFREGDYRDKLKVVFGEDVADRLAKAMEGQEAMWMTDDALQRAGGSQTARMLAGRLNPSETDIPRGAMQAVDQAIAYPARKVLHAMMKPSRMTRSLGPTLAAQGTDRDRLVQALLDVEMAKAMGQSQNGSAAIQSMLRNWSGSGSTSVASTTDPNELANVLRLTVYPKKRREASAY